MANMYLIIAAFITAIILGRIIIPKILIISLRKRLFDAPDARKIHKRPIPRLGGVTFFPVILCTTCFFTALRILLGYLPDPQFTGTVNPAGHVIATSINRQTNTVNPALRKAAEDAAKKARFNAVSGLNNQTGTITYYFNLK